MFCTKCGTANSENNRFCEKCGAPLEGNNSNNGKFDIKQHVSAIALVGLAMMILGVFFPFVTVSLFGFNESVSLINWDGQAFFGIVLLIPTIIAAVMLLTGKKNIYNVFAIISVAIATIELIYIDISLNKDEGQYFMGSDYLHYGFGHHLVFLGIIILIVSVVLKSKKLTMN